MKLLRSKAFVVVLVLAAVGLILKNIMPPLFFPKRPISRVEHKEDNIQKKGGFFQKKKEIFRQVEALTGESLPVTNIEKLGWAIEYAKDPFKIQTLQVEAETASIEKIKASGAPVEEARPRSYTLVGVVEESGKILAVINEMIVGVGDYYEDYEVIKIDSDSIELKGPNGYIKLEF